MIKCVICQESFSEEQFKSHPYKIHKIKQEDYFFKYYNKRDLFTGERIPFKSIGQYLSSDFINKNNLRSWVKTSNKDTIKDYCIKWLANRKEKPETRYAPSHVELKTLVFPPVNYLDELFQSDGGYYKICESLGYFIRHEKIDKNTNLKCLFEFNEKNSIIIDTREHKPLIFPCAFRRGTLGWGDYAVEQGGLLSNIRVERKSLADFIGTFSKGYDRFCREIERAEKEKGYLVILVEEKFSNFLGFNFLPHISRKTKASPEFISHRIREISQKYDNINFIFADGRREATRLVMKIFQLGEQVKKIDVQLAYEIGAV